MFGGLIVQLRAAHPEVSAVMVYGAWTQLITGVALVGLLEAGLDPAVEAGLNYAKIALKLAVTAMIVVLVAKNRKYLSIPKGLWGLLAAMTLLNAGLAVLWQ